ncbi:hypothetical protein NC652_005479 [Populus alba x Populus x berolinensis]|nr:hypothetical protein NC652_005479 [Populus alba x Populus x berolinensis]
MELLRFNMYINCFFRVGGAAILLSNKPSNSHAAKYQVIHAVRPNTAASDSVLQLRFTLGGLARTLRYHNHRRSHSRSNQDH